MPDFFHNGSITTIHDLGSIDPGRVESMLESATRDNRIGLVLPVTASDMRAPPFERIVSELAGVRFIDTIVVSLGVAPEESDMREALERIEPLGDRASLLWVDGPRVQELYGALRDEGLNIGTPGKGQSVWTAFGFLLGDPALKVFALHDCDIVNYERQMVARLCLPLVYPSLDFEFCKAYYARTTDRMHGRVARLLVTPIIRALDLIVGPDRFLTYLDSFRYPLSGEFAVSANLARSNRIPSDWGLEIGTLAEVLRNASVKRVCQVDLCSSYEHKHQPLSLDNPDRGLIRMARDILCTIFRTLSSMGTVVKPELFLTLRSAYLRAAQDAIRRYSADALVNGLLYDRHEEELIVEAFAQQVTEAGRIFESDPSGQEAIPNWTRVLSAMPDFPARLRDAVERDARSVLTGRP